VKQVNNESWGDRVEIVLCSDVILYLAEEIDLRVDFMWLDLMTESIRIKDEITEEFPILEPWLFARMVKKLELYCLAVTIAGRSNVGHSKADRSVCKRVQVLADGVCGSLPHKVCDWGYQSIPGVTQAMHLAVFGRAYEKCMFRIHKVKEWAQDPNMALVKKYGSSTYVCRPGTVKDWRKRIREGERIAYSYDDAR
jgi:hypothetical protein